MTHGNGELIVLVDKHGKPTGEALPKLEAHHANTPFYLAFSCYLLDGSGNLLVTQRALSKKVWPGVWTNSFCGHPVPGEPIKTAVRRRAVFELGAKISDIACIVPDYRYTTPPFNGIIENEYCPIFIATLPGNLTPNPDEVEDFQWMTMADYIRKLETSPDKFSYWRKDQLSYILRTKHPRFA